MRHAGSAGYPVLGTSTVLEQTASKRKRFFSLTPCFDVSLWFLTIPSNRKDALEIERQS
jgi:hypothetical protein